MSFESTSRCVVSFESTSTSRCVSEARVAQEHLWCRGARSEVWAANDLCDAEVPIGCPPHDPLVRLGHRDCWPRRPCRLHNLATIQTKHQHSVDFRARRCSSRVHDGGAGLKGPGSDAEGLGPRAAERWGAFEGLVCAKLEVEEWGQTATYRVSKIVPVDDEGGTIEEPSERPCHEQSWNARGILDEDETLARARSHRHGELQGAGYGGEGR